MLFERIDELLKSNDYVVVCIEGCAASGKTTLSRIIQNHYLCEVIKMDDFFLPLEKRTKERFDIPGGNIDYERFKEEVIDNLGTNFTYGAFNCSKMKIDKKVVIKKNKLIVVEGSYSMHPYFGKYYDLSIFIDIDYDEQIKRIKNRDGEVLLKMFIDKWIKYEQRYFSHYNIKQTADIYLEANLLKR